jgi:hypothetical protein
VSSGSTIWGVFSAAIGLLLFGSGVYFMRFSAICAPDESHIECARSWLGTVGPIIAMCALLIGIWQLAITRDSSERQIRAYAGFHEGGIELVNAGSALRVTVVFRNAGRSPARSFTTWVKVRVLPKEDPSAFLPRDASEARGSSSVLQSDGSVNVKVTFEIPARELAEVRSGLRKVFVWGGADYSDVFDVPRFSRFYDVNSPSETFDGSGQWELQPASRGYESN